MQLQQAPGVNVCPFSSRVPTIANCLLKVVEQEPSEPAAVVNPLYATGVRSLLAFIVVL